MKYFTFEFLLNFFKKRYKLIIIVNFFTLLLFFFANQTVLSEKINRNYSVTFDYEFDYSWVNNQKKSIEFNEHLIAINSYKSDQKSDELMSIPFLNLKNFQASFFELVYRFNINDLKTNDYYSDDFKMAEAFNFDTNNFTYKNRKLHLGWSDPVEAEEYLKSLHRRAKNDLIEVIKLIQKNNTDRYSIKVNNFWNIYNSNEIANQIKIKNNIKEGEFDYFVNLHINKSKFNKLNLKDAIYSILNKDNSSIRLMPEPLSEIRRSVLIYYALNKWNAEDLKSVNYFPEFNVLLNNIDYYLPQYHTNIGKIKISYIYILEILFSFLLSILIAISINKIK